MTDQCNKQTRRILNFPAIFPCESVAFPSLLDSLIHVCHSICECKSQTLSVNRKSSRRAIRLIETLLICLEEIPNEVPTNVNSISMSLSELHFVLQKVHYLMEDCTRDNARLWMLMNSAIVSDTLRVLIRAMLVALDVLPLEEMEVSEEVKEYVELVRKQAGAMKFEVEADDQGISNMVFSILDHFENGIDPNSSDLRRVLEYLGIRSWSECNREVKFLEGEISSEWQTEKKKDLGLLSSLMGFMIYCRSIVFEAVDKPNNKPNDDVGKAEFFRFLSADDFRCPITLEYMTDPVIVPTGQTYERSSIRKWFKEGNLTCPKTGEKLPSADLVPNSALKQIIQSFCLENGISSIDSAGKNRDASKTQVPGSLAAEKAMKLVANFLVGRLVDGTSHELAKAVYEIRLLTKTSVFNRSCFVEAGAIPTLLNLLFSNDPLVQENTIASLLNLSKFSGSRSIIVENGGLVLILDVLKRGLKMETRQHAAGSLCYLASVEEYRMLIGEIPEAIPALMELLRDGTERCKKNVLVTIFGLLLCPENHKKVLAAGLVPMLVDLLRSCEREDLVTDSLAVLASLADKPDATASILSSGTLPTILEILGSSSSMVAKENCVSLLLSFCVHSGALVVPVLVENPSLMGRLYSQITVGTPRASKKASSLIKILHNYNERSSNPALPQERYIHVW